MLFLSLRNNLFLRDKIIKVCLLLSLFLIIVCSLLLYLRISPQVAPLYLRYSVYFGIDLIGPWWAVFFLPLAGLVILVVNFILAYSLFLRSNIISYFLVFTALAVQLFLIITAILIILLNS
ncbi:hypothetical protein GYA13_00235 [Candidatus Kuenenbacteria bacterium]|nr:hypothetical protein [Candidatus Kuenenbacteria bacterium]